MAVTAIFAATALMCLPACITERSVSPRTPNVRERADSSQATALTTRVDPARSETSSAKVALQPLGYVPYDGLVLPLISPDGKYLATQVGEAPTWETLLALPGASIAEKTYVEIYDLGQMPPIRMEPPFPRPHGLLLGIWFSANSVSVEVPQADGSRMIGGIGWKDGWFSLDDGDAAVNSSVCGCSVTNSAFACLAHVVHDDAQADGVIKSVFETFDARGLDIRYALTAPGYARGGIAFGLREGRLELLRWGEHSVSGGRRLEGMEKLEILISSGASAHDAYAAVSAAQCGEVIVTPFAQFLFFHPGERRMASLPSVDSPLVLLAPNSIAGCWASTKAGPAVLLTMSDGLYLQRLTHEGNSWRVEEPTRLLREPYVPRATYNPERPYILIGPGPKDRPEMLQIVAMKLIEE